MEAPTSILGKPREQLHSDGNSDSPPPPPPLAPTTAANGLAKTRPSPHGSLTSDDYTSSSDESSNGAHGAAPATPTPTSPLPTCTATGQAMAANPLAAAKVPLLGQEGVQRPSNQVTQELKLGAWPSEPVTSAALAAGSTKKECEAYFKQAFPPGSSQPEEDWPTLDANTPHPHPEHMSNLGLLPGIPNAPGAAVPSPPPHYPPLFPFPSLPVGSPTTPLVLPALTGLQHDQLTQLASELRSQLRPDLADADSQTVWETRDVGVSARVQVRYKEVQTTLSSTKEPLMSVLALRPPEWEEEEEEEEEGGVVC